MPPTFRPTTGALFASASAATAALPSVWEEHDIYMWVTETDDVSVTPPDGWVAAPNTPISQPNAPTSRMHVWLRRATASEANATMPDSGDHQIGKICAIAKCHRGGTVLDAVDVSAAATDDVADTSASAPGLTTTGINRLVVNVVTTGFDHTSSVSSWYASWTNTSLQSPTTEGVVTERSDNAHIIGNGGTLGIASGFKPVAGTVDPTDVAVFAASTKAMYSIAFKPDDTETFDVLTSGQSSGNTSPYTTLVVAAPATAKLYLGVEVSGTAVATPTVTGMGLTWTLVDSQTVGGTGEKLAVYEAQVGGSAVSGALTITVSTTPSGCNWVLYKVMGHNQTGTTVQTVKTAVFATTVTLNFAAAANSLNRQIVFVAVSPQNTGNTITPEAGWVEGAEVVRSTPNVKLWAAHQPTAFDTSITVADDSEYDYAAIGLEINFTAGGSTGTVTPTLGPATTALSGTSSVTGTVSAALPAATTALAGTSASTGTLTPTTGPATASLTATSQATATLLVVSPAAAAVTTGTSASTATLTPTLPAATTALVGDVEVLETTGTVDAVLPAATVAASGSSQIAGTVTAALGPATSALSGTSSAAGTLSPSLPTVQAAAAGASASAGTLSATTGPAAASLNATATGTGALDVAAPAAVLGLAGPADFITATMDAALPPAVAQTAASSTVTGTANVGLPPLTAAVDADAASTATAQMVFPAAAVAAVSAATASGVLATTIGPTILTAAATATTAGTLTAGLPAAVGAFPAASSAAGTLDVDLPAADVEANENATVGAEVTYTPGEPYLQTIPGPPYVTSTPSGWGSGGWGDTPWGG